MLNSLPSVDEREVALKYLGKPWYPGGRGPLAFDCWGLCMEVYQNALGVDIGTLNPSFDTSAHWTRVANPTAFSIVYMTAQGQAHAGLWLTSDRGGVLHAVCGWGVVFTPQDRLKNMGIKIISFYDYVH